MEPGSCSGMSPICWLKPIFLTVGERLPHITAADVFNTSLTINLFRKIRIYRFHWGWALMGPSTYLQPLAPKAKSGWMATLAFSFISIKDTARSRPEIISITIINCQMVSIKRRNRPASKIYARYHQNTNIVVFSIISVIKQVRFHLSSNITRQFGILVHIYCSASSTGQPKNK